eukprot:UN23881
MTQNLDDENKKWRKKWFVLKGHWLYSFRVDISADLILDVDFITYANEIIDEPSPTRIELLKSKFGWLDEQTIESTFQYLENVDLCCEKFNLNNYSTVHIEPKYPHTFYIIPLSQVHDPDNNYNLKTLWLGCRDAQEV